MNKELFENARIESFSLNINNNNKSYFRQLLFKLSIKCLKLCNFFNNEQFVHLNRYKIDNQEKTVTYFFHNDFDYLYNINVIGDGIKSIKIVSSNNSESKFISKPSYENNVFFFKDLILCNNANFQMIIQFENDKIDYKVSYDKIFVSGTRNMLYKNNKYSFTLSNELVNHIEKNKKVEVVIDKVYSSPSIPVRSNKQYPLDSCYDVSHKLRNRKSHLLSKDIEQSDEYGFTQSKGNLLKNIRSLYKKPISYNVKTPELPTLTRSPSISISKLSQLPRKIIQQPKIIPPPPPPRKELSVISLPPPPRKESSIISLPHPRKESSIIHEAQSLKEELQVIPKAPIIRTRSLLRLTKDKSISPAPPLAPIIKSRSLLKPRKIGQVITPSLLKSKIFEILESNKTKMSESDKSELFKDNLSDSSNISENSISDFELLELE